MWNDLVDSRMGIVGTFTPPVPLQNHDTIPPPPTQSLPGSCRGQPQPRLYDPHDLGPLLHGTIPDVPTGKALLLRPQDLEPPGPPVVAPAGPGLPDAPVLGQHADLPRRDGVQPHGRVHGGGDQYPLPGTAGAAIDAAGVPRPDHARQQVVAQPVGDLGQGVGAQGHDGHEVGPAAQLDVQDGGAAAPGRPPLVLVLVDGVDARQGAQARQGGLLGGLAGQEAGGGGGQDQADGEPVRVGGGQGGDYVWDLDGCYGAAVCVCVCVFVSVWREMLSDFFSLCILSGFTSTYEAARRRWTLPSCLDATSSDRTSLVGLLNAVALAIAMVMVMICTQVGVCL